MNSDEKRALLVDIIRELDSISSFISETHIQKAIYFLSNLTPCNFGYSFVLYKHGPFSFDLSSELEYLESLTILCREDTTAFGCRYSLGPTARTFRSLVDYDSSAIEASARQVLVQFFSEEPKLSNLERDATALFAFMNFSGGEEEKAQTIHKVKPHIDKDEAAAAIRRMGQLKDELSTA